MLSREENVARVLFSPRMIYNGELQIEAFQLRGSIAEDYLSVLRTSVSSWREDVMAIPQRKNRELKAYAEMNVGEIRDASFLNVAFEVKACDNERLKSHGGIFVTIDGKPLIGGQPIPAKVEGMPKDFVALFIQQTLLQIAEKGLHIL